jgi:hypothetical protein
LELESQLRRAPSLDPAFHLIDSEEAWAHNAPLPSRLHWIETDLLWQAANLRNVEEMN